MFCKKCGMEIDDQAAVCTHCGCSVVTEEVTPVPAQPKPPFAKIFPIIANAIGTLSGALCFLFAIISKAQCGFDIAMEKSYGGDAYTGIQNAAAVTANNVNRLGSDIASIACMAFIVLGLALIAFFRR